MSDEPIHQRLADDPEWERAFRRIFVAAKEAELPLGPVILWSDFCLYPEALGDLFETALAGARVQDASESVEDIVGRLEDAASDVSSAASSLASALHAARGKR